MTAAPPISVANLPAEVRPTIEGFLELVQDHFRDELVAVYCNGSIALGAFDGPSSDVDLVVVTRSGDASADTETRLASLHATLRQRDTSQWPDLLEVQYVPAERLADAGAWPRPHLEHYPAAFGAVAGIQSVTVGSEWAAELSTLRSRGVVLFGVSPDVLVCDVNESDLRQAMATVVPYSQRVAPAHIATRLDYQSYLVLSACRRWFTAETGRVTSKPDAARWVRGRARQVDAAIGIALAHRASSAVQDPWWARSAAAAIEERQARSAALATGSVT